MKMEILKSLPIAAFTPDGDYLAIVSSNGTLKASSFSLCCFYAFGFSHADFHLEYPASS